MNERAKLLKRVQVCDFVLVDTAEYLDSHPTDKDALEHYKKYKKLYQEAHNEYVDKFGPLGHMDLKETATKWEWVESPWPWEGV